MVPGRLKKKKLYVIGIIVLVVVVIGALIGIYKGKPKVEKISSENEKSPTLSKSEEPITDNSSIEVSLRDQLTNKELKLRVPKEFLDRHWEGSISRELKLRVMLALPKLNLPTVYWEPTPEPADPKYSEYLKSLRDELTISLRPRLVENDYGNNLYKKIVTGAAKKSDQYSLENYREQNCGGEPESNEGCDNSVEWFLNPALINGIRLVYRCEGENQLSSCHGYSIYSGWLVHYYFHRDQLWQWKEINSKVQELLAGFERASVDGVSTKAKAFVINSNFQSSNSLINDMTPIDLKLADETNSPQTALSLKIPKGYLVGGNSLDNLKEGGGKTITISASLPDMRPVDFFRMNPFYEQPGTAASEKSLNLYKNSFKVMLISRKTTDEWFAVDKKAKNFIKRTKKPDAEDGRYKVLACGSSKEMNLNECIDIGREQIFVPKAYLMFECNNERQPIEGCRGVTQHRGWGMYYFFPRSELARWKEFDNAARKLVDGFIAR